MTPVQILAAVLQLIELFPTVEPALVQAIRDFKSLVEGGTATQAEVDAQLDRVRSQSATIQSMS